MINKIEIEEYLMNQIKIGYVYFIYSDITKMVYVNISSYNFYTKHNAINYELAGDVVNPKNEFKVLFIETKYHKHLEKTYIRYLSDKKDYSLYNTKKYKTHKYVTELEIDFDIIDELPTRKRYYKQPGCQKVTIRT
jgi:hypothetical protein